MGARLAAAPEEGQAARRAPAFRPRLALHKLASLARPCPTADGGAITSAAGTPPRDRIAYEATMRRIMREGA